MGDPARPQHYASQDRIQSERTTRRNSCHSRPRGPNRASGFPQPTFCHAGLLTAGLRSIRMSWQTIFLCHLTLVQIQQNMEQLLNRASNMSDLAFLRVLQLVHSQTSQLVEDLKGYEVTSILPRSPTSAPDMSRIISGSAPVAAGPQTTAIGSMLETAMEELFVPYTEGQRYIEKEIKCLGDLYTDHLTLFTRYHVRSNHYISQA